MKTRILELILAIIGLISLASLGAILVFVSPSNSTVSGGANGQLILLVFSISLFFILMSIFTLLGIRARKKFINERTRRIIVAIAFREGLFLSLLGIIYIWLAHFNLFKVWIAVPLFLAMIGIEYLILSKRRLWTI